MAMQISKILLIAALSQAMVWGAVSAALGQSKENAGDHFSAGQIKKLCGQAALQKTIKPYIDAGLHEYSGEICLVLLAQNSLRSPRS